MDIEQNAEPISLYCNDETDSETFADCEQMTESLPVYEIWDENVVRHTTEEHNVEPSPTV